MNSISTRATKELIGLHSSVASFRYLNAEVTMFVTIPKDDKIK